MNEEKEGGSAAGSNIHRRVSCNIEQPNRIPAKVGGVRAVEFSWRSDVIIDGHVTAQLRARIVETDGLERAASANVSGSYQSTAD